ncbi:hypothetical protein [Paenibacillus sp. ISL-20]|uniref:hypothetical protein n=1 Tax=Paenibacillus sp. ISL-20 TaxID=2819163 RepID=UPI001BE836B0|nr:hypothetical protein [Paenibacillus sp. ISL-20]MBT2759832.1 hypothetical protein [Paenibacillus sp. ISL-20]
MSSCLIIQKKDQIWVGSDTAISTSIKGNAYRVSNEGIKLFNIDKNIVFCSGSLSLSYSIMSKFQSSRIRSVDTLSTIARSEYEKCSIHNKNLDIIFCSVSEKMSTVVQISPYNDFIPINNTIEDDNLGLYSAGIKTNEIWNKAYHLITNHESLEQIFIKSFFFINSEEVGGNIKVYSLNKNGSHIFIDRIMPDNKIRWWKSEERNGQSHLVIAERIIGKLLLGNKLLISDDLGTFTIEGNLLTIKDKNQKVRVLLGEYKTNTYGLAMYGDNGKTIIDQDGILSTDTVQEADNVDSTHPLKLKFYIDPDVIRIDKVKLSFSLERFRAYSKGAASQTINLTSTQSERINLTTTESASIDLHSTSPQNISGGTETQGTYFGTGGHNHGIAEGTRLATHPVSGAGYVTWVPSGSHSHPISLGSHTHGITVPSHSHSISMPSHSHQISMPSHSHDIVYGIYEGTYATGVQVIIDGAMRDGTMYGSDRNIDITQWITTPGWHTIELTSSQLGRINASVYIKSFVGA